MLILYDPLCNSLCNKFEQLLKEMRDYRQVHIQRRPLQMHHLSHF